MILRIVLIVATLYTYIHTPIYLGTHIQFLRVTVQQHDGPWQNVLSAYLYLHIYICRVHSCIYMKYRVYMCIYMLHSHMRTRTYTHMYTSEVHLHMHAYVYQVSRFKRILAIDDVAD